MAECQTLLKLQAVICCDAVFYYMAICGFSPMSNGIKLSPKAPMCVTFCSTACYYVYQGGYSVLVIEAKSRYYCKCCELIRTGNSENLLAYDLKGERASNLLWETWEDCWLLQPGTELMNLAVLLE